MSDATGDAQIQELQDEVAQLKSQLDTGGAKPKGHWIRTFWSTVLIVVAVVLAPLSVVSVWARGEVTDTDRFVATVAPLAQDPAIQDAVATRITTEIFQYIDIETLANDAVSTITENRDLQPRQAAALAALDDQDWVEKTRSHTELWRNWLSAEVTSMGNKGLRAIPSRANFVMIEFPESGPVTAAGANEVLMGEGIIARYLAVQGMPRCLRITIGTEDETRAAGAALRRYVEGA